MVAAAACPSTCRAKGCVDKKAEDTIRLLDELEARVYGFSLPTTVAPPPRCMAAAAAQPAAELPLLMTTTAPPPPPSSHQSLVAPPSSTAAPGPTIAPPISPIKLQTPMVIMAILICGFVFTSARYILWRLAQKRKQRRFEKFLLTSDLQELLPRGKGARPSRERPKRKGGGGLNVEIQERRQTPTYMDHIYFLILTAVLTALSYIGAFRSRLRARAKQFQALYRCRSLPGPTPSSPPPAPTSSSDKTARFAAELSRASTIDTVARPTSLAAARVTALHLPPALPPPVLRVAVAKPLSVTASRTTPPPPSPQPPQLQPAAPEEEEEKVSQPPTAAATTKEDERGLSVRQEVRTHTCVALQVEPELCVAQVQTENVLRSAVETQTDDYGSHGVCTQTQPVPVSVAVQTSLPPMFKRVDAVSVNSIGNTITEVGIQTTAEEPPTESFLLIGNDDTIFLERETLSFRKQTELLLQGIEEDWPPDSARVDELGPPPGFEHLMDTG